jgi:hypothetical protein
MQPTLRQVPPKRPGSTIAIFWSANRSSMIVLPEPEPITHRSKWRTEPIVPVLAGHVWRAEKAFAAEHRHFLTAPDLSTVMSPGTRRR